MSENKNLVDIGFRSKCCLYYHMWACAEDKNYDYYLNINLELFANSKPGCIRTESLAGKPLSDRGFDLSGQSLTPTQSELHLKQFSLQYNVLLDTYTRGNRSLIFGWWKLVQDCDNMRRNEDAASKRVSLTRSSFTHSEIKSVH